MPPYIVYPQLKLNMSCIMRIPAFSICKIHRHRSAAILGRLIYACVFHCLESIISICSKSEILNALLASVAAQADLCLT